MANEFFPTDDLDLVEAIEEAIGPTPSLTPDEREELIIDFATRLQRGRRGDEGGLDDDALATLVRNLGPRSPRNPPGHAGATAHLKEPWEP